jgi:hypothetical protein
LTKIVSPLLATSTAFCIVKKGELEVPELEFDPVEAT